MNQSHTTESFWLSCACYVSPFTDCNDRFLCPFIYFNREPLIPTLSWNVGRFAYTQVDSPTRSKSFRQHSCAWSSISIKLKQVVPEAWKRYPFRAEPPRLGYYWEYPRTSPSRLCGILHPRHESLIERKYNCSLREDVSYFNSTCNRKSSWPGSRRKEVTYTTLVMFYCKAADNLARNQNNIGNDCQYWQTTGGKVTWQGIEFRIAFEWGYFSVHKGQNDHFIACFLGEGG